MDLGSDILRITMTAVKRIQVVAQRKKKSTKKSVPPGRDRGTGPHLAGGGQRRTLKLTLLAFKEVRLANPVHVVSDGERALDYFYRRGDYQDPAKSPRPDMILHDLKRPKIGELEILKTVKEDVNLTGAGLLLDHFHY
ncbi:MAG: hypothetical protein WD823_08920 [Sulfuricaulis sp.]|uniref:hypothetical protein n=1 Tax=Sulfuricaulis sp. TaxID=2003553 RepID=UPI0034A31E84